MSGAPLDLARRAATGALAATALLLAGAVAPAYGPAAPAAGPPPAAPSAPVRSTAAEPAAPAPGAELGTLSIPRLEQLGLPADFTVREGVERGTVLDSGAVGHYEDTQLPGEQGNLGLAAHRNGHGEPFRHLDRLSPGDRVVLRTPRATYTYALDRELPETGSDNYGVLDPVPAQAGYTGPGHYLTLTTCTPEFTSLYRLVWWGHLVSETPAAQDSQ
ncbi:MULTISPECIES: class E sortase [Kitasatospora]|uniref:Putative peptidase C60 family protein n=1 Tax=Kitasatospora setae (strain ATCC 33774 / DSM 43861 / JCM 3304 / KCC A-0304 / NBRC 14216 / KM-6054) TaxID=452652 RepID=E4NKE1_KITSK|nr:MULTISPECIES: class E sortase [Kitasatospora]BAJ32749.1 putative peptidase C60 family protein [Kitasatospora setae KM-6054]